MSLVEEAVRSWEAQRAGVIAEVENTPEEALDYRPGEGARSFREIATHIAEAGVAVAAEVIRPDGNFARLFDAQLQAQLRASLPPAHTRAEIVDLLRITGEQTAARLREVAGEIEQGRMTTLGGVESRLTGLWFGVTHEMYHRGQLAVLERGFGQKPALTKSIEAMLAG